MRKLIAILALLPGLAFGADNLTDYFENQLLDYLFRAQSLAPAVSSYKVDVYKTCPTDSTTGTKVTETGYAQATITSGTGATGWNATQGGTGSASSGTGGMISNAGTVSFGTNNSGSAISINCIGILDSTGTNLLIYMDITGKPVSWTNGATLTITGTNLQLVLQ